MPVNGYVATKDDWDPAFVVALARHSSMLLPDNRGIGASPGPVEGSSIGAMAADVLVLMDARGVAQADVAGWSMGGFVAQALPGARLELFDGGGGHAFMAQEPERPASLIGDALGR